MSRPPLIKYDFGIKKIISEPLINLKNFNNESTLNLYPRNPILVECDKLLKDKDGNESIQSELNNIKATLPHPKNKWKLIHIVLAFVTFVAAIVAILTYVEITFVDLKIFIITLFSNIT